MLDSSLLPMYDLILIRHRTKDGSIFREILARKIGCHVLGAFCWWLMVPIVVVFSLYNSRGQFGIVSFPVM